jgi:hypothetical protein
MKKGGFDVFEGLPDDQHLDLLLAEARASAATARLNDVAIPEGGEWRGGSPARRFWSAPGGPVQRGVYHASRMRRFLAELCGVPLAPSGGQGTYTYYAGAGHHLGIHRDVESCDVAVITCLHDNGRSDVKGGLLVLYPERLDEPVPAIRKRPTDGAVGLQLRPRQTLVMLGGIVPHAVLPVGRGQARIVSVLCYRMS